MYGWSLPKNTPTNPIVINYIHLYIHLYTSIIYIYMCVFYILTYSYTLQWYKSFQNYRCFLHFVVVPLVNSPKRGPDARQQLRQRAGPGVERPAVLGMIYMQNVMKINEHSWYSIDDIHLLILFTIIVYIYILIYHQDDIKLFVSLACNDNDEDLDEDDDVSDLAMKCCFFHIFA